MFKADDCQLSLIFKTIQIGTAGRTFWYIMHLKDGVNTCD